MADVHYKVVQHDGGWAYTFDGSFSEPFPSADAARKAANRVAAEQHIPGDTTMIEYQDKQGAWHIETAEGTDRPEADVV